VKRGRTDHGHGTNPARARRRAERDRTYTSAAEAERHCKSKSCRDMPGRLEATCAQGASYESQIGCSGNSTRERRRLRDPSAKARASGRRRMNTFRTRGFQDVRGYWTTTDWRSRVRDGLICSGSAPSRSGHDPARHSWRYGAWNIVLTVWLRPSD